MFYSLANFPVRPARSHQRSQERVVNNGTLDRFLAETCSAITDAGAAPAASVEDLENAYSLSFDVPGLARDQLEIGIEGDVVRVTSKPEAPRKVKAAWRFPLEIDPMASTAKLENGVLSLSLGKKVPASNVTQLNIQ